jgi:hypothetical protein
MFDLWFNGGKNEVMIQYDFNNNGTCDQTSQTDGANNVTFGGSNGVPTQAWHLCSWNYNHAGCPSTATSTCTVAWKLGASEATKQSESSGSIDVLAMIKWLENNGQLPANSTWSAFSMGWEISSTGGSPETWTGSGMTVHAS